MKETDECTFSLSWLFCRSSSRTFACSSSNISSVSMSRPVTFFAETDKALGMIPKEIVAVKNLQNQSKGMYWERNRDRGKRERNLLLRSWADFFLSLTKRSNFVAILERWTRRFTLNYAICCAPWPLTLFINLILFNVPSVVRVAHVNKLNVSMYSSPLNLVFLLSGMLLEKNVLFVHPQVLVFQIISLPFGHNGPLLSSPLHEHICLEKCKGFQEK